MNGTLIVNRLKEVLGKFTNDFTEILSVSSLSRSAGIITAITSAVHGLETNDYVTVRGAKEPIELSSLTREGNLVTAVSATSHKLSDPSLFSAPHLPLHVTISGADAGYNGTWELISVPDDDTFIFKITGTPTSPANVAGNLLLDDFDGYNGYKQVTVINETTFTYETNNLNLAFEAQGSIQISGETRVEQSGTAARLIQFYSESADGISKPWMFVVLDAKKTYKDGTISTDNSSSKKKNSSYWYEGELEFSIFVIIPSKDDVLGATAANLAQSYEKALVKSLVNFIFPSPLAEQYYQPVTYLGSEPDDYIGSYYSHRFDFKIPGLIQDSDVAETNPGVPLQLIDGTIKDKGMTFNPLMRS